MSLSLNQQIRDGRQFRPFKGGPLEGLDTEFSCSYLNAKGDKVSTPKGDEIRRSGKGGLYYLRGAYYEWNNR